MAVGNVQVPVHQGANNVGVAANHQAPQQQGAVQFRSGNKNIFTRIAEHIGLKTPHTAHGAPNAGITLKTPSKRDLLTTFASVSMGDRADRTEATGRVDEHGMAVPDMAQHRQNISTRLQFTNVNGAAVDTRARLNLNYTITNSKGEDLRGFSISANPAATAFDTTRPIVLYLSGSGGSAENYGGEIGCAYATRQNCNFMAVNYRGYGDSDQTKISETSIAKDATTMINHLIQNEGFRPDQIIVHGYSMGASAAANLQARVEETGHELRGVIYDRPMTSATGAAHDTAKEVAQEVWDNNKFKSFAGAIGTAAAKLTVGSMSAHKTLKALQKASPNNTFASTTVFTHDTGTFGARSDRMATDLGGNAIDLQANHFNQGAFVAHMNQLPGALFA